jgi:hypothetical protein
MAQDRESPPVSTSPSPGEWAVQCNHMCGHDIYQVYRYIDGDYWEYYPDPKGKGLGIWHTKDAAQAVCDTLNVFRGVQFAAMMKVSEIKQQMEFLARRLEEAEQQLKSLQITPKEQLHLERLMQSIQDTINYNLI